MDEKKLLAALKSGSEEGYRTLVDLYQAKVINICLGYFPIQQDAEDLAQEVFVKLFSSVEKFRGEASLGTWVYRIAVNKCLEMVRYRKRTKRMAFFQSLVGLDDQAMQISSGQFDHPGVTLENKERTQLLYQHIEKLPEKQRTAFILSRLEGLSYQEICAVMEVSLSSVESLLFRAKQNLKKTLRHYYEKQMI